MIRNLTTVIALLLVSLLLFSAGARADEYLDRAIVVDRSGSMWAKLDDGETRFEVADKFAESLVREMAAAQPDATFSLVALGHRFPRALQRCDDVETLVPPTTLNSRQTVEGIAHIASNLPKPQGMTPLTQAIGEARKNLPHGGSIIVISDFDETCDGDAEQSCAAIAALRARGALIGISIRYVVALADLNTAIPGMSKYAECTGAKLLRVFSRKSAEDTALAIASDLKALSQMADLTVDFELDKATDIAPVWGSAPLEGTIDYAAPQGQGSVPITGSSVKIHLRSGAYRLTVTVAGVSRNANLRVVPGQKNYVRMTIHAAHLSLSAVGPEGEAVTASDLVWTLRAGTGGEIARESASPSFDLPPGDYRADVRSGIGGAQLDISVGAGETLQKTVRLDAALAAASEGRIIFTPIIKKPSLFADRAAGTPYLTLNARGGGAVRLAPQTVAVPVKAGTYDATVVWHGVNWPIAPIKLDKDATVNVSATFSPSTISATLPHQASKNTIWRVTSEDGTEVSLRGSHLVQSLPPGAYSIEARLNDRSWQKSVVIKFGTLEEVVLDEKR